MAERSPGARVVRRRLGSSLRKLREDANIRIEAAARELECSPAKISRLENGQGPAKLWDVRILLDFYGVADREQRRRHEDWARDTKSDSWWEPDSDLTTDDVDRYIAAETVAARIRIFCTPVLPAQLQTPAYATAHTRLLYPKWPQRDVDRFVSVRRERQAQLLEANRPFAFEAIIDEAAVMRRVGTAAIHLAQLEWLEALVTEVVNQRRPNLSIRIIPLTAGPGRALSPFTIFEPRHADLDPTTAFIEETADGGTWVEPVSDLVDIYEELHALSVGPEESLTLLREAIASSRRAAPTSAPSVISDERKR